MLFPKESARIVDTWDVQGLRGTGSHHFEVEDLLVPAEHTVWNYGDKVLEPGPIYAIPMVLLFACGFASVAVGVARAALDALGAMAASKTPRGAPSSLREAPMVHLHVGQAEAILRAARAYLHTALGEVWQAVAGRGSITLEERVDLRRATTHAIRLATDVVDIAYNTAGSDAIYAGHPIQRRFQDMHVITQHIQGRLAHYESVGRFQLGLEPDKMWL
jgi:alkylation response protein AidB-like acyl-CoA dehydrogenase